MNISKLTRADFKIMRWNRSPRVGQQKFSLETENEFYLHSNGRVLYGYTEYWPTREMAEEILDKYYPKPAHVWEHGDVFRRKSGTVMMYSNTLEKGASVFCVDHTPYGNGVMSCLDDAVFLFNIKDKL